METRDFAQEQAWLDQVYREIDEQLEEQEAKVRQFYGEMREIRRSLSEEHGISSASDKRLMDAAQRITELRQEAVEFGVQHRLLQQLRALERNPYFGRIDFHEEGFSRPEAIYIGVRSLLNRETGWPMVYDWRAPISSMYYDYGLGEAHYEGPGGEFRGTITLKRQYGIKDRRLTYMFDNELTISDELLREALGRNTSAKMRTIVNTIQREQNQAIRNDQDERLLVEGAAGSGKTAVALHRIAYMLYKYRDTLQSENILVFSPNKVFSDYISQVLPDLGEENVPQLTFKEFAESFFDWNWDVETQVAFVDRLLRCGEDEKKALLEDCRFKCSPAFQQILDRLVQLITEQSGRFHDLSFGKRPLISAQEQAKMFHENYAYLPVQKRLAKIRQRILHLLRPMKKRRIKAVLNAVSQEEAFEHETWLTRVREAVRRVWNELKPVMDLLDSRYVLDTITWYKRLWQDRALWERVGANIQPPPKAHESLASLAEGVISFADAIPLLYLKGELEGYPVRRGVLHVVIDEVQDYAPLQLEVLFKTFPQARYTLVGDVKQSLHPYVWGTGGGTLEELFSALKTKTVRLNKSYRSTQEIFHFCGALSGGSDAETVLRSGRKPLIHSVDAGEKLTAVSKAIHANLAAGYETIAVITKTALEAQELFKSLRELGLGCEPALLLKENAQFSKGVLVLPVYLAKGLEFDAVVIADAGADFYRAEYDRRLLYVACSRALHSLDLVYSGQLSPFIQQLPPELFELA